MTCRLTEAESSAVSCGHSFALWQQHKHQSPAVVATGYQWLLNIGEPRPSLGNHSHLHDLLTRCGISK